MATRNEDGTVTLAVPGRTAYQGTVGNGTVARQPGTAVGFRVKQSGVRATPVKGRTISPRSTYKGR